MSHDQLARQESMDLLLRARTRWRELAISTEDEALRAVLHQLMRATDRCVMELSALGDLDEPPHWGRP